MSAIAELAGAYEHGRVEMVGHIPLVFHDDGRAWEVTETGQQYDAWPYPESTESGFDDQSYMQTHLRGKGTLTAEEKVRELIGDPQ
jgi:hypothetical protein